jgi:hypothetical protein
MPLCRSVVLLAVLSLSAVSRARAQFVPPRPTPATASGYHAELAPFAAFRMGGSLKNSLNNASYTMQSSFAWGGSLDFVLGQGNRLTLLYSRQETEVDTVGGTVPITLQYVHVGGTRDLRKQGTARPFVTGALGIALADAAGTRIDKSTKFGLSGSIGLRTPGDKRLAIRGEARGYLTFVGEQNTAGTCGGGGCAIVFQSGVLFQGELALGLGLRF